MNAGANRQKVRVGLLQINNSFSGQNYLPLSVGMLQAYAQNNLQQPDMYEFLLPVYKRIPVQKAVESLVDTDVVFVSTYVWNMRISLQIAERVKRTNPETVVVFGGPQVPERDPEFLNRYPFIDLACHGEGEQVAVAILENLEARNWQIVPSVSFRNSAGEIVKNPKVGRVRDLSVFPSPYLDGVFEPLIEANSTERWIALWETNRGCPFSCTFCDWGSAVASKVNSFEVERIMKEVDWFANNRIEFIFCCDANFGILPRDLDIVTYVAETKRRCGFPQALSVQATKNATERAYQTQKVLAEAGLNKGIDIALQSIDPTTLKNIKRGNISTDTYQELQRRFTKDNVETYTDLIIALPGETYDSFADAVSIIITNGQHNRIQFNNLSILPNAEMGDPEYQKKFGMQTVTTKVVNIHGSLDDEEEVFEQQELVIATDSMPKEAWVQTRVFCWMTALLYFDKVFQIPLTEVHECTGVDYRELLELFSEEDLDDYPDIAEVRSFFWETAQGIQNGGYEYVHSDNWLKIWWPADEYILIKLVLTGRLEAFYNQAEMLLDQFLRRRQLQLPPGLLREACALNRSLIKKPFQTEDLDLDLSYNIWERYRSVLRGQQVPLEPAARRYHIDRTSQTWSSFDAWCREVIWWGNKKGAYLYGTRASTGELAGHF